ncbi:TonB-dependent receptor [Paucibacter sp. DJ1R-11]|uniref:TonB-dependent receptor n=1 Tax=Paucibacter sp. DJ1R-11 TaxID=2893556 RepID=UPI0021E3F656|nr:TonB-dependent receptor [Paucibacter sp. DJ1R-11]MCV2362694.1 TonB-dependent receptor [Paucibacter sp. DJ1R-11]
MRRLLQPMAALACLCLQASAALGQSAPAGAGPDAPAVTVDAEKLDRVEVAGRHYDNAIGSSDAASQGVIRAELLKSRPALRPGELLEFIPGLIVTQHSGDGKANQYFLRGFNLDHGTDFATSVNGLPVNMPTHGHGQGYSDLNFLMPELVDRIDYRKGPYFAQNADFASAGSTDIAYRSRLDAPFAAISLGGHGYRRAIAAGSTDLGGSLHLLAAVELQGNDGPWTVPEGLRKSNGLLTLSSGTAARGWSASLMGYAAHWTSTDQIPERLLGAGRDPGQAFGRFDSLDPSDGGKTHRSSLSGEWHESTESGATRVAAYVIDYRLQLFSNFSYALERPDEGDQFSQQDRRQVYGFSASRAVEHQIGSLPARSEVGMQLRQDRIRVGLFDTVQRQLMRTTRDDKVREGLYGFYAQTALEVTPWLRTVLGLRADAAHFSVDSRAQAANSGRSRDHLVSPKLSLIAGPWAKTEFFFNAGRGFHSNDARGTTASVDPKTGAAVAKVPGLVASRGMELGARSEWIPGLQSSLALWTLDFNSELVYVGDAGATEPTRPSTRRGIEWNNRWIPLPWLLVDADLAWTHARFSDADPVGRRIPNAVDKVGSVAVTVRELGPWSASVQWRYLGSGPLTEDNSVRSRSSLTTNLRISRQLGRWLGSRAELSMDVFNLLDRKLNDIEYHYESQLPGEPAPVADRHIHPAEPRAFRFTLRMSF